MKRATLLLTALFLLVTPMSAAARGGDRIEISYRITEAPFFFDGPAGLCAFTGVADIEDLTGNPIGTSTLCVETFDDRPPRFVEHGTLSVDLPDGQLAFEVTFTDVYNSDDTAASHSARGKFTGGTGRYQNGVGILRGSGVILFDAEGIPQPFLTYTVRLTVTATA